MFSRGDALAALAGQGLRLQPGRPLAGQLAGPAVVLDDTDVLAGLGDAVEAEDLHGLAGERLADALAAEVVHRAHPAPLGSGDERVAHLQGAAADKDRDHRTATRVEL